MGNAVSDKTILDELREDHGNQRRLLDILAKTSGDSDGRRELFARLRTKLEHHAAAEERSFYRPLFKYDETLEKARHSVAEHHEIDELIEQVAETPRDSSAWLAHFTKLREKVEHHLDEEERDVFPLAGRVLDETTLAELAEDYRQHRRELAGDEAR